MIKSYLNTIVGSFAILSLHAGNIFAAPPPQNPGVLPPNSHAFGTTYEDLAGAWFQWAWNIPSEVNPILDQTGEFCDINQEGKIWFLAGNFGGVSERTCTVPAGKALFFPLLNGLSLAPEFGETEDEIRQDVNDDIDCRTTPEPPPPEENCVVDLVCEIDGVPLQDLYAYRTESPEGGFVLSIEEGGLLNQFGFAPGDREPAVADGYWILLAPLSKGRHVIEFIVLQDPGVEILVTWYIEVI